MKLLLIENDPSTTYIIKTGLVDWGYSVVSCDNALDGLQLAANEAWDLIIVDRRLPGDVDGLSIISKLRQLEKTTPALVVSAPSDIDERVHVLRSGADDYIFKPVDFNELLARVEALLRRANVKGDAGLLQVEDLCIDTKKLLVTRGTTLIQLQPSELRLLAFMMQNAGKVITRATLLRSVRDSYFDPQTNVIDVRISRLRGKVDRGFAVPLIHTIRGIGYMLGKRD